MNNTKKIILIVLINMLMITMGVWYYKYMVDEYKKFIEKTKLRITTLGLEEASAVIYGDGVSSILEGSVTGFREDINAVRASFLSS